MILLLTLIFVAMQAGDTGDSCPNQCASAISAATTDLICGTNDEELPSPCQAMDGLSCAFEILTKCGMSGGDSGGDCPDACVNALEAASTSDVCECTEENGSMTMNYNLPSGCELLDFMNCAGEAAAKCASETCGSSDGGEWIVHDGVGWCVSEFDGFMWNGPVAELGSKTASECWDSCSASHPDIVEPRHEFGNDGTDTWCYCQDGCPCMSGIGDSSTLAPAGFSFPAECEAVDNNDDVIPVMDVTCGERKNGHFNGQGAWGERKVDLRFTATDTKVIFDACRSETAVHFDLWILDEENEEWHHMIFENSDPREVCDDLDSAGIGKGPALIVDNLVIGTTYSLEVYTEPNESDNVGQYSMKLICCDPFTSGKNWNERTACLAEPNPIHSDTDDSDTDATTTYTQLDGDFRCTGTSSLYSGNPGSADACRAQCDDNDSCNYYAAWDTGHCETYSACPSTAPDGSFVINRFEKDSPPDMTADPCVVAGCSFGCLEDIVLGSCDDHSTEVARHVWDDPSHEGGALQGYCTTDAISCSSFGTQITEPAGTDDSGEGNTSGEGSDSGEGNTSGEGNNSAGGNTDSSSHSIAFLIAIAAAVFVF